MSDGGEQDLDGASRAFAQHLEKIGFFSQISDLEKNLKSIADGLKDLGETATRRLEETESLAAHLLAIESILSVMLESAPVDAQEVRAAIRERTAGLSKGEGDNPAVQIIAEELLSGKGD